MPQQNYLKRNTPYPLYEKTAAKRISGGEFSFSERESYWRNGAFDALVAKNEQSEYLFENPDLMITDECEKLKLSTPVLNEDKILSDGTYGIYELPYNATGMIAINIKSQHPIRLYLMFDEILSNADRVDYLRGTCCNAAIFDLPAGERTLRFFEVYTCKYLQAAVYGGDAAAEIFMIEYKHPPLKYTPKFAKLQTRLLKHSVRAVLICLWTALRVSAPVGFATAFFREERNTCFAVKLLLNMTFWKISFVKKNMLTFPTV